MAQRPYTIIVASIFITSLCCIGIKDIRLVIELRSTHVIIMVCKEATKCWDLYVTLVGHLIDIFCFKGMKHEATKCGYLQTAASFRIRPGLIKTLKELANEYNH